MMPTVDFTREHLEFMLALCTAVPWWKMADGDRAHIARGLQVQDEVIQILKAMLVEPSTNGQTDPGATIPEEKEVSKQ